MRCRTLIILTPAFFALLGGCQRPASPVAATTPAPASSPSDSVTVAYEVTKSCDAGRAIYVFDGFKEGGIAVVENAAECSAA